MAWRPAPGRLFIGTLNGTPKIPLFGPGIGPGATKWSEGGANYLKFDVLSILGVKTDFRARYGA